jgi:hypothetical protein
MIKLSHRFVKSVPETLEDGVIYVSVEYATAIHKCCCGCGNQVVTPFSPTDWQLTFDGKTISLSPSIGNWNYQCRSHYWITNNVVKWAPEWSKMEIEAGRKKDELNKKAYYKKKNRRSIFGFLFSKK